MTTPAPQAAVGPAADRDLAAAILARDRKATAEFVSIYTDAVYAYVGRRLAPRRDLVDDLVQDIFLAALDHLASYRGEASLRSWLLGVARHKVEDYYRDRLRQPLSLDEEEPAMPEPVTDGPSAEDVFDRARAEQKTQSVLQRLPEPYGLVLLWRYWENRSARQIAGATGRTEKAVERLLARARARFRSLWEDS